MHENIDSLRRLFQQADEALTRQMDRRRLPKERERDLAEAAEAHRQALAVLTSLARRPDVDQETRAVLAAMQTEVRDLEALLREIRFDGAERQSLRARYAGGG